MRKDGRLWIQINREAEGLEKGKMEIKPMLMAWLSAQIGSLSLSQEIQEEEQVSGKVSLVLYLQMGHVFKAAQCTNGYRSLELV